MLHYTVVKAHGEHTNFDVKVLTEVKASPLSGVLNIEIPSLGISTYAKDFSDVDIAIQEAIQCLVIASERHGNGVKAEFEAAGWKLNGTTLSQI
jgi:hypothetical protein